MGDLYNAVFEGGGAKGIAYAGALQACEEAGVTFSSVAGSSAGAITAALVASGYSAQEIAATMPDALAAISGVSRSIAKFGRTSLLTSRRLQDWLAVTIAAKVAPDTPIVTGEAPACTFADVRNTSGISLYVVTLDLATRQPVVFSPDITPDAPVAPAVVASCSIPVAFPPARMSSGTDVRRLVDGGTWANYPSFVFHDLDFIDHHRLEPPPVPTIGFILDGQPDTVTVDAATLRPVVTGRPSASDHGSSTRELDLLGAVVSSRWFRWMAALLPILFIVLSVTTIYNELWNGAPHVAHLPAQFQDLALVLAFMVLAVCGVLAFAVAAAMTRFGSAIFDSGLVGARAAMGVGPSVPYWVGTPGLKTGGDRHTAVRIPVPGLKTLSFSPAARVMNEAIRSGYDAAWDALVRLGHPDQRRQPIETEPVKRSHSPASRALLAVVGPKHSWRRRLMTLPGWPLRHLQSSVVLRAIAILYASLGSVVGTYQVLHRLAEERIDRETFLWVALVTSAVLVSIYVLAINRSNLATRPPDRTLLHRFPVPALWFVAGATAFGALSVVLALTDSATWRESSIVTALNLDAALAKVDAVDSTGISVTYEVPDHLAGFFVGEQPFFTDRQKRPVGPGACDNEDGSCLFFITAPSNIKPGDDQWLYYDAKGHQVVLDKDFWSADAPYTLWAYGMVALILGTVLHRSLRMIRIKKTEATLPAATAAV